MNWKEARRRYCYPETKDGVERYYAVVHGQSVEITREMYEVMEPSYRLEWEMKYGKKSKRNKSIEQLAEQIVTVLCRKHCKCHQLKMSISCWRMRKRKIENLFA